jgi:hypothetical protein
MLLGVEIAGVEGRDVRQQRLRQMATFDLLVRQRLLQILVQGAQCRIAVDPGELAVPVATLTAANALLPGFVDDYNAMRLRHATVKTVRCQ